MTSPDAIPFSGQRLRSKANESLASDDGNPNLKVFLLARPVANRQRSPYRPFRIVLMGDRRTEQRHDRVADELLNRTPMPLDLGADALPIRILQRPHILWIQRLGDRSKADQVGEQDTYDLALLTRRQ
jgi:hypothetical protein